MNPRCSRFPPIKQAIATQEHALSVLVGRNPGPIARSGEPDQLHSPVVPAGLPSDLLFRRPDILQAEQQLIASNALIGAARALFFPRISLTGLFGLASGSLGNLFTGSARTWTFTGDVAGPIYTGGGLTAAVDQATARRDQSLANYELVIQNAFRDVEDSLADCATAPSFARRCGAASPRCAAASSWPTSATRMAIPTIWKCWTPSAACSPPSCSWHRRAAIINGRWSISIARWAATGPRSAQPPHRQRKPEEAIDDRQAAQAARPVRPTRSSQPRSTSAKPPPAKPAPNPMRKIILIALGDPAGPVRLPRPVRPLHALQLASAGRDLPDADRAGGRRRRPGGRRQGQWRGQEGPAAVPDRSRALSRSRCGRRKPILPSRCRARMSRSPTSPRPGRRSSSSGPTCPPAGNWAVSSPALSASALCRKRRAFGSTPIPRNRRRTWRAPRPISERPRPISALLVLPIPRSGRLWRRSSRRGLTSA